MATVISLISDNQKRSVSRQEQLQEIKEFRFAKGKLCPHCSAETVSRNDKYKGKQRANIYLGIFICHIRNDELFIFHGG